MVVLKDLANYIIISTRLIQILLSATAPPAIAVMSPMAIDLMRDASTFACRIVGAIPVVLKIGQTDVDPKDGTTFRWTDHEIVAGPLPSGCAGLLSFNRNGERAFMFCRNLEVSRFAPAISAGFIWTRFQTSLQSRPFRRWGATVRRQFCVRS